MNGLKLYFYKVGNTYLLVYIFARLSFQKFLLNVLKCKFRLCFVGRFASELLFLILGEQHLGGIGPLHHREQKRLGLHPTLFFSTKKNSPKEKKTNMSFALWEFLRANWVEFRCDIDHPAKRPTVTSLERNPIRYITNTSLPSVL
jgi:hypothetical protein